MEWQGRRTVFTTHHSSPVLMFAWVPAFAGTTNVRALQS